jgi:hypothetical protein
MYFEKELEIHKKIFPHATPQDQLWHLCEEINEMRETEDDLSGEWADALFVAISLQRFKHTQFLAELVIKDLYFNYSGETQNMIYDNLLKVIKKVKSRKYYFINGHYERDKNV